MKNKGGILLILLLIVVMMVGCSNIKESISEEEAIQKVMEKHTNENGEVEVISIDFKNNAYIIEWQNEENTEFGKDKVKKNGDIELIESQIE